MEVRDIPPKILREMYVTMLRIRVFEEEVAEGCREGKVICPAHLYTGQEAVAAGVCANLRRDDYTFGTHRGHGLYIAKGGDLKALMAEIFGRETGCSKGKGGSMHIIAPEIGILGTSSLVGGIIPLAVGTALASTMQKNDHVSVAFFGDAGTDEGVSHESFNFASLKKLPVIFVCENNYYSSHLHLSFRQPRDDIVRFAEVHNMLGIRIDGNDVLEVYRASREAVKRARRGEGPTLLECIVNRWRGHVGPNWDYQVGLRSKEQVEKWKKNCPIKKFRNFLLEQKILSISEVEEISDRINKEIEEVVAFAENSPYPDPSEVLKDTYKIKK
jgi:pyruvate dehydrogenase E1 component alpha subunit